MSQLYPAEQQLGDETRNWREEEGAYNPYQGELPAHNANLKR
jgi:hypothetical protein